MDLSLQSRVKTTSDLLEIRIIRFQWSEGRNAKNIKSLKVTSFIKTWFNHDSNERYESIKKILIWIYQKSKKKLFLWNHHRLNNKNNVLLNLQIKPLSKVWKYLFLVLKVFFYSTLEGVTLKSILIIRFVPIFHIFLNIEK